MQKIMIFGHKKPDTDSVTAAIALADLKNELEINSEAYVLGNINNETKFVLNYFNIKEPKYLNDVKLQVKNLKYEKGIMVKKYISIFEGYKYMVNEGISTLPIIDENNKFIGAVSMKEIAHYLVDSEQNKLNTSYKNILNILNGEKILNFDNEIIGDIIFASFKSATFIETISLNKNSILVVGDRNSIIEYAIEKGVKLIIVTGNGLISQEHIKMALEKRINIIKTPFLSYKTNRLLPLTNYVNTIINNEIITVNESDYVDDFIDLMNKTKKSNYPVLNKNMECLGLIKYSNIHKANKKQVILVDHNENQQSVEGIEEAEILEIIDHHKIVFSGTSSPINFRNMPVGSTNTIIYKMYLENKIKIKKEIAGIMLSGIISDTLLFKSPTTTEEDRIAVENLANIANINYMKYADEMFEAGSSLEDKTIEEIIFTDHKIFNVNNKKIGVSQVFTTNAKKILNNINDYIKVINNLNKINDYYVLAFFITDIIKEGSYLIYADDSEEILEKSFDIDKLNQGFYMDKIVSRKKQIIPNLMEYIEKK